MGSLADNQQSPKESMTTRSSLRGSKHRATYSPDLHPQITPNRDQIGPREGPSGAYLGLLFGLGVWMAAVLGSLV